MSSEKKNEWETYISLLFRNLFIFFSLEFCSVWAQCKHGLEPTCGWMHSPKTNLLWQMKSGQDPYVELTKCQKPCGIGIIQSPWLPPRDEAATTTIYYKIYGTSKVYLRLHMELDDTMTPRLLFSKDGNYAYGYPKEDEWRSESVTIPPTHTKYKLLFKAFIPYSTAMVAVKDINLDGTVIASSTESSSTRISTSTTSTTTATTTTTPKTSSTIRTSTTTSTTTPKPYEVEEEEFISPTHYIPEIKEYSIDIPETWDESDHLSNDDDEDEDKRRFQALEMEDVIKEDDLTTGYTRVVEPQICMYK